MSSSARAIYFLLIAGFTLAQAQSAQKIEGHVRDGATGAPLAGANVLISGTSLGMVSDFSGYFFFENLLVGTYTLQARHIGYAPQTLAAIEVDYDQAARVVFNLEPRNLQIPGMVITARRSASAAEVSLFEISRQQIERSQAADLGELLVNSCGLEVQENGGNKSLSIRGSQSSQVVVVLDGVRLDNPMTGAVDLATLPVSAIESILVRKGSSSLEYGAGAIGGVVEIRTRRPQRNLWSIEGHAGAFGGAGGGLAWSGTRAQTGWYLSADHRQSGGDYGYRYMRAGAMIDELRRNADTAQNQLFARLVGNLRGAQWSLSGQRLRSERGLPGQIYSWTPGARATTGRDHFTTVLNDAGTASGWEIRAAHSDEGNSYRHQPEAWLPLRVRTVPAYWNENRMHTNSLALEGWRQVWSGGRWIAGAEAGIDRFVDRDRLEESAAIGEVRTRRTAAFFRLEAEQPLPHGLAAALITGLRRDEARIHHTDRLRREGEWSPVLSLALTGHALADLRLFASWSRGFRLPTYADLFYQQYRVQGNPDLLPERSRSHEYGLSLASSRHGRFGITRFRNRIEDLIIWRMGSFASFSPVNTDALLAGTEFEAFWTIAPGRVEAQVSHLFLESTNLQAGHTVYGKRLPYRPDHTTKLGFRLTPGRFFLEYAGRLAGPRYVTEANTVRLPGYAAHDLTLGMRWAVRGVDQNVRLALHNLTDARYELIENAPLPGREWRISWEMGRR